MKTYLPKRSEKWECEKPCWHLLQSKYIGKLHSNLPPEYFKSAKYFQHFTSQLWIYWLNDYTKCILKGELWPKMPQLLTDGVFINQTIKIFHLQCICGYAGISSTDKTRFEVHFSILSNIYAKQMIYSKTVQQQYLFLSSWWYTGYSFGCDLCLRCKTLIS